MRRLDDLLAALGSEIRYVVVDLTARAYDGLTAIQAAAGTGARIVAVGQHDDIPLRKAALAAGAERVFTYRALFEDGPAKLGAWLAAEPTMADR